MVDRSRRLQSVAIAGHDASCFTRYGPAGETFTLGLGGQSHLDLPVREAPEGAGRPAGC